MATDYPDFGGNTALATLIQTLLTNAGLPTLTGSQILDSQQNVNVAGGTTVNFPFAPGYALVKPSYEIFLSVESAAATAPGVVVTVNWIDNATGTTVAIESWLVLAGQAGDPHSVVLDGRTKSDSLFIQVTNLNAVTAVTIDRIIVSQNSRSLVRDRFRTTRWPSFGGFTKANTDWTANTLATSAAVLAAGASATRLMPCYNGLIGMGASTPSGAADLQVSVDTLEVVNATTLYDGFTSGNGKLNDQCYLPRSQCTFTVKNTSAAQRTINLVFVQGQE